MLSGASDGAERCTRSVTMIVFHPNDLDACFIIPGTLYNIRLIMGSGETYCP